MTSTTTSTITVNVYNAALVSFSDGTEIGVVPEDLRRSELLRDSTGIDNALEGNVLGESCTVAAPEGYLEAWLESLRFLDTNGHLSVAHVPTSIGIEEALKYLKITSRMQHHVPYGVLPWAGVYALLHTREQHKVMIIAAGGSKILKCALHETLYYNTSIDSALTDRNTSVVHVVQFMEQYLPPGLLVSVLRASEAPVGSLLDTLPPNLHGAVLEAEFPSLSKHQTLTLNCDQMTLGHAARMIEVARGRGTTDPMDHLNVMNLLVDDLDMRGVSAVHGDLWRDLATACKAVKSVSLLLHISEFFDEVPDHVQAVMAALTGNTRLISVDMSITVAPDTFLRFDFEAFVPLNRSLRSLAFDVQETKYKRVMYVEVPDVISRLTNLTSFELKANFDTEEEIVALLRPLQQLGRLSLKHNQGRDTKQIGVSTNACLDVCVGLRHLTCLSLCGAFDRDMKSLGKLSQIRSLDCSSVAVRLLDNELFALAIQKLSNLENLSLCLYTGEDRSITGVIDALEEAGTCHSLHSLELHSAKMPGWTADPTGDTINEQLQRVSSLKKLSFDIYAYAARSFQKWLHDGPDFPACLTCLEFADVKGDIMIDIPEATNGLFDSIGRLRDLKHLTCHMRIMNVDMCVHQENVALCNMFENLQQLLEVHICEEMFVLGAEALAKVSTVTCLTVQLSCRYGEMDTAMFESSKESGVALATMTNLKKLEVHTSSPALCQEICAAVGCLRQLHTLDLGSGSIPEAALRSVSNLTRLQRLALGSLGQQGDPAVDQIDQSHTCVTVNEMLRHLSCLQSLFLCINVLERSGVEPVVSAMAGLTSLTYINLKYVTCDGIITMPAADDILQNAIRSLVSLPKLRELRAKVGGVGFQKYGRSQIASQRPSAF